MKASFIFILSLSLLLSLSCKKDHPGNETPDEPEIETGYSKLKKITSTSSYRGNVGSISYEITSDSINNKIMIKSASAADSVSRTYSYNSNNQLVLYEVKRSSKDVGVYLSRMELNRNTEGQLTKVLSEYTDGGKSEGVCQYEKNRDTTFITFIDTANKSKYWQYERYTVGLVKNRIVSTIDYDNSFNGVVTTIKQHFTYDGSNNLIQITSQYNDNPTGTQTYVRGNQSAKELQKFFNRLGGDIMWFKRYSDYRFMNFLTTIADDYFLMGNVVEQAGNYIYTNEFDSVGNLKKISFNEYYRTTYEFEYWP
ncbi:MULTISPECIES: hypothetical protein [Niastella]|uniref:DUF4595 domain-containing protein n=1 Tax=Niastella soli TaxID=2821487 RepID=A0ABS3YPP8_9BACT|nr:hypothetical protein [Niastella soli]MBO9199798.1 hypothetical protein [Niastella soli]